MKESAWSKLSSVAELVSSIAILITLVYLAIQVQQNTDAFYAQSRASILDSAQLELFESMRNPDIPISVTKPGDLTLEENSRLNDYLTAAMRVREYSWLQYRSGVIDDDLWGTEMVVIGLILSAHRTRKWWNLLGRQMFNPEFVSFIDAYLVDQPISDENWEMSINWSNL